MPSFDQSILCDQVALTARDGRLLFSDLTFSLGCDRVGLVGRNGSGKSSLLNLIAQRAAPTHGSIRVQGSVALLDQLPPDPAMPVPDALGIGADWARLERIETGQGSAADFDDADWALPARVEALIAELGLPSDIMRRAIGSLSGGERMRAALAKLLISEPDTILLDEPTNNLDAEGRAAILALLANWKGGALVASHDRALLGQMDRIVELTPVGCQIYGGGWEEFTAARDASRARAQVALENAAQDIKTARRDKQDAAEKQARRDGAGKAAAAKGGAPKILLGAQKRRAEATAGRARLVGDADIAAAQARHREAQQAVEILNPIRFAVPPTGLASQHRLIAARGLCLQFGARLLFGPLDFDVRGPERIALTGPNGSGKTSLLALLLGTMPPTSGTISAEHRHMALLDQHMSLLDSADADETLLVTMQRLNPALGGHEAHAALASAGYRGDWSARLTASLSGGERMRLALACLFARPETPQLIVLDEPTNHLDMEATRLLETALCDYDGALICVSHDAAFRDAIGLTRAIHLGT